MDDPPAFLWRLTLWFFRLNRLDERTGQMLNMLSVSEGPRQRPLQVRNPGGRVMPHIIVEYSANLEGSVEIQRLVDNLHQVVVDSGVAEVAAIRTRAERRDVFRVADGNPKNAFVHVTMRLRVGRSEEVRSKLANELLAATDRDLQRTFTAHDIAITVEMEEIDNITARKNTIRSKSEKAA
jgi:5-carboxymethyl-2-hydroxymuconate isomerase